jgi:hypothetical protein
MMSEQEPEADDIQACRSQSTTQWQSLLLAFPESTRCEQTKNGDMAERWTGMQFYGWSSHGDRTIPIKGQGALDL